MAQNGSGWLQKSTPDVSDAPETCSKTKRNGDRGSGFVSVIAKKKPKLSDSFLVHPALRLRPTHSKEQYVHAKRGNGSLWLLGVSLLQNMCACSTRAGKRRSCLRDCGLRFLMQDAGLFTVVDGHGRKGRSNSSAGDFGAPYFN